MIEVQACAADERTIAFIATEEFRILCSKGGLNRGSKRNPSLPRNEVILSIEFCLGVLVSTGNLDDTVEDIRCHFLDSGVAGENASSVQVDDVRHSGCHLCICRQLHDGEQWDCLLVYPCRW